MEDDDAAEDVVRNDDVGDEDVTGEFVVEKKGDDVENDSVEEKGRSQDREPAKSKCTWTCRKSRFMRQFSRKMFRP